MVTRCYFHDLFSELRLIVAKFLLENREHDDLHCPTVVDMLFHPDSPFLPELRGLFPELRIDDYAVYSKSVLLSLSA